MPVHCRGLSLSINSGGQELVPHGIELDEGQHAVAAYIASTAGEEFNITLRGEPLKLFAVHVYLDGWGARRVAFEAGLKERKISHARISGVSLAPMCFSEYSLVDSDDLTAAHDAQHLGTIKVEVYQFNYGEPYTAAECNVLDATEYQMTDFSRVIETSKKAGGHRVVINHTAAKHGPIRKLGDHRTIREQTPLCTFKCFYQPEELLIAKGIMPRPPPSSQVSQKTSQRTLDEIFLGGTKRKSPVVTASTPATSSSHESKRLKTRQGSPARLASQEAMEEEEVKPRIDRLEDERNERIRALEEELNALRTASQISTSVKRERPPSPIRVGNMRGEVIDLTGDDD